MSGSPRPFVPPLPTSTLPPTLTHSLALSAEPVSPPAGKTLVRQSGPPAHCHNFGSKGPAFQGRRAAKESLRKNLLPARQKVRV